MKIFRKKLSKQDEKVLAEASKLATGRLEQYISERRTLQTSTTDTLEPTKKPVKSLIRLHWW